MTTAKAIKVLKNSPAWDYLSQSSISENAMTEFCDAVDVAIMCTAACDRIHKTLSAADKAGGGAKTDKES